MSGDKAPLEMLKGAAEAAGEYEHEMMFIGDIDTITSIAAHENININLPNIKLVQSNGVITMDDMPLSVVRDKKESSMGLGLRMLADGQGDAFVSAGNTGALHAGSTLVVRRIKGVPKSAIATILPYKNPTMLLDSGANVEIDANTYLHFAHMGSIYMKKMFGIEKPRVGLVNIGSERAKGTKTVVAAYELLEAAENINFVGNVEGKDLPLGGCDIAVADGFTGNIILKLTEGCGAYMMEKLKGIFYENMLTKLSAAAVKKGLKKLKTEFTASEYGGAPLLGLSKTVIKAHGGSDALAFRNAIRQSIKCVDSRMVYEIALALNADFAKAQSEPANTDNTK